MVEYYATIYDNKKNAQTKVSGSSKEKLYERLADILNDKPLDNISVEIYGIKEDDPDNCWETERFVWEPKMIDLNNYADIIRKAVKAEDEKDSNWRWSVRSIGKHHIKIYWGYLGYANGKNDCFLVRLHPGHINTFDEPVCQVLSGRNPDESEICFNLVTERDVDPNDYLCVETKIEEALPNLIHKIAAYAHYCY